MIGRMTVRLSTVVDGTEYHVDFINADDNDIAIAARNLERNAYPEREAARHAALMAGIAQLGVDIEGLQ